MEKLEKNETTGGDVKTGVIPVLQGSDTGCPNVRVVLPEIHFLCNQASKATCRLDMEDTVG